MKTAIFILALAILYSHSARAALGDGVDSIETDRHALSGSRNAQVDLPLYTIEEIATGSGTVREFVSSSGIIFAVAWKGYAHPNLSVLLGSKFTEYQAALGQTPRRRGARNYRSVASPNIVVETWGHMRRLQGRAVLSNQVPVGVSIDEIR